VVAVAACLMWALDYYKRSHEVEKLRLEVEKLRREQGGWREKMPAMRRAYTHPRRTRSTDTVVGEPIMSMEYASDSNAAGLGRGYATYYFALLR
jgi:hypothetical protein